jgi:hypothetical protein
LAMSSLQLLSKANSKAVKPAENDLSEIENALDIIDDKLTDI